MKTARSLSLLRTAALCLVIGAAPTAWSLDTGATVPELNLPGLKDNVNLNSLKGKVVYVDFWASWCGPCKQSFPFMNDLLSKYRAKGLEIVAINLDAKRVDADKFLAEVPAQFSVAFDAKGDSAKSFAVKGMPSSFLIGRDGKVLVAHKGFREEDRKTLESSIAQALAAE